MNGTKLQTIENLVDELGPADRVRLLQYLAPRITGALLVESNPAPSVGDAWQKFREAGAQVAAGSVAGESIAQAVSDMRR